MMERVPHWVRPFSEEAVPMKALQTTWPRTLARLAALSAAVSVLALVTACGGSGGSPSSTGGTGTGQSGSTQTTEVGPVTLAGVAAIGAPLIGARVSVVDARGVTQGSTTTNASDGSYAIALTATNIPLPLLIEAAGVDMTGAPVTLHTVVQTASTGANRITANIHPITEAVVAMLLGTDPLPQFRQASTLASTWTQLGNATALASASDLIKTIIKANITDAKVTDSAGLDFFQDVNFTSNKVGLDGVLEGLNIQVGQDRAGREQLEISNRLRAPSAPEVTINLSSAKTQLAAGSSGKVANAITSTAKITTSVAALMNYVSTLDNLVVTLNHAMAEHAEGVTIAQFPIFSTSFVAHDGGTKDDVSGILSQFGGSGLQLSRFQFTGCADYPVPTKGCTKPTVSALLSDSTGQIVDVFDNVVTYATSTGWTFRGNDQLSNWALKSTAWASWDSTGAFSASGQGVQILSKPVAGTAVVTLVLPSSHSVSMADCGFTTWCLSSTPTGDLVADYLLQSSNLGWFGQQDSTRGALYQLSALSLLSPGGALFSKTLATDVPQATASSAFPLPDGLASGAPLTCTNILAGFHLTWQSWATANPALRMQSVRTVVSDGGISPPWIQEATVYPLSGNYTDAPAVTSPPATIASCQLWMVAQDKLGRRFMSKIVAAP